MQKKKNTVQMTHLNRIARMQAVLDALTAGCLVGALPSRGKPTPTSPTPPVTLPHYLRPGGRHVTKKTRPA
jgi:hypothetical protein